MRINLNIVLLTLSMLSVHSIFGQNTSQKLIDSLEIVLNRTTSDSIKVQMHNEIYVAYRSLSKLDLADRHARNALAIAEKAGFKEGVAASRNNIAIVYAMLGDFDKAVENFEQALKIREAMGDELQAASLAINIGITQARRGHYPDGLQKFLFALRIFEKFGNASLMANAHWNIGNIYYFTKEFEKAEDNYLKAIHTFRERGDRRSLAGVYANLAPVYGDMKDSKRALEYYQKAYDLADSLNQVGLKALVVDNMGLIYEYQGEYDQALQHYTKALELVKDNGDPMRIGLTHFKLGRLYNKIKQPEQALFYLKSSLETAKKVDDLKNIRENYESLSEAYALLGDHEAALAHYRLFTQFKDSLFNEENTRKLTRLEVQFEADKRQDSLHFVSQQEQLAIQREMQLAELRHEYERKQAEARSEEERRQLMVEEEMKRQYIENEHAITQAEAQLRILQERGWRNVLIAGLVLFLVIGGLLFYQSRTRKRHNEKLSFLNAELEQANKTKLQFFNILNHDLRRPVANLIHFLHLKKDDPELLDQEGKERLEQQTMIGAENLLNNMEDLLLWSKGQMESFTPSMENIPVEKLLDDIKLFFSDSSHDVRLYFENADDLHLITDENYLKTILRNLTSNAIQALRQTVDAKITWKATRTDNQVVLSILDNGPGADHAKFRALYDEKEVVGIKSGLGLHLIRDLAKAINCVIEVHSDLNTGTCITLKVPVSV